MASLPAPPALPPRDVGWLAQSLPVAGSLVSLGVLGAASGHALMAVAMVSATVLATAISVDVHRERWRRDVARTRRSYADTLAALAPAPDWTEPTVPPGADPVGVLVARRALVRLRVEAAVSLAARSAEAGWGPPDLRAELAPGCVLDLREAAAGGVGPHGVIMGATGSGKSELVQGLVLSLALRHRPADLAVLLIDFKGGAALAELAALPHCAGLITNLADDAGSVPRMARALTAEVERRQRRVREGESVAALIVVIDEFSELLGAHPAMIDLIVRLGRVGRSLGIHLILASQRLDETRVRELEAHLSWRLALRTFTESESRAVIGVPDAVALPREPGWALLRTGPEAPQRVRVAPAGAEFRAAAIEAALALAGGVRVDQIWRPALTTSPAAADLEAEQVIEAGAGAGATLIPIGLADDPVDRVLVGVDPLAGHLAVVGRPRSGKSSLLEVIVRGAERRGIAVVRVDPAGGVSTGLGVDPVSPGMSLLVVDDWSVVRQEHPEIEDLLVRAAVADPQIRLVIAAHRWADVRPGLRDLLTTRIELRLADPFDSVFDRHLAAAVPLDRPGWGLTNGTPFLAALP